MGEKKNKALELELIDDLLNEKEESKPEAKENDNATTVAPQKSASEAELQVEEVSLHLDDKTVDLASFEGSSESASPEDAPVHQIQPTAEKDADPTKTLAVLTATLNQDPSSATKEPEPPTEEKVRASVGRYGALRTSVAPNATEAALAQSESLRIAQTRILELEQEIERLRQQNEQLGAAGETLRRRADELLAENQRREGHYKYSQSAFDEERGLLQATKEALQRDLELARRKNEELELRISTNIQKIRVRERELENRLELMKMESTALIRSKDEIILEMKRQIDTLNVELNNYRSKNQELNRLTNDKQEMLRRTVKALRLALNMLEGEEEPRLNQVPQRKVK